MARASQVCAAWRADALHLQARSDTIHCFETNSEQRLANLLESPWKTFFTQLIIVFDVFHSINILRGLCAFIRTNPNLKRVSIHNVYFLTRDEFSKCLDAIAIHASVTAFELIKVLRFTPYAASLAKFIATNTSVTHLTVRNTQWHGIILPRYVGINDRDMATLADGIAKNRHLTHLDFGFNEGVGEQSVGALVSAMSKHNSVTSLCLESTSFRFLGTCDIARYIRFNPNMTTLNLASNVFTLSGMTAIFRAMQGHSNLTHANLRGMPMDNKKIALVFVDAIKSTHLVALHLGQTHMHSEVMNEFVHVLSANKTITAIDFSYAVLIKSNIQALTACIATNTTLKTMDLSYCNLYIEDIYALIRAVSMNKNDISIRMIDCAPDVPHEKAALVAATALLHPGAFVF